MFASLSSRFVRKPNVETGATSRRCFASLISLLGRQTIKLTLSMRDAMHVVSTEINDFPKNLKESHAYRLILKPRFFLN